mmetsp:Transcript_102036/g.329129  ORF Transcript_102036/g.329129 Transcript_102036/m.329129 type:complete len:491 (-) Transcript_102036:152-1624(-)
MLRCRRRIPGVPKNYSAEQSPKQQGRANRQWRERHLQMQRRRRRRLSRCCTCRPLPPLLPSAAHGALKHDLCRRLLLVLGFGRQDRVALHHFVVADSAAEHLPSAPEAVLLDVLDAMFLANALDERLQLAVLERRHVREHVVLDLVVEPAVENVHEVIAGLEVHRGIAAAQEPLCAVGLARCRVTVQVLTRVVASDDHEGVGVGQQVRGDGENQSLQSRTLPLKSKRPQARDSESRRHGCRQHDEHHHRDDDQQPLDEEHRPEESTLEIAFQHMQERKVGEVEDGERLGLGPALRPVAHRESVLARVLELLEGVGRVVRRLPCEHPEQHRRILHERGQRHRVKHRKVTLHEVRVRVFGEVVMVHLIVFNIPSSWEHPIQPIDEAPPPGAEDAALVVLRQHTRVLLMDLVVATVSDVVPDDDPPHTTSCGNQDRPGNTGDAWEQRERLRRTKDYQDVAHAREAPGEADQELQMPSIFRPGLPDGLFCSLHV